MFSCPSMRSHFLCMTFKTPALSNTQASPFGSGLVCLLEVSSLNKGGEKERTWLLHLKQIKVPFLSIAVHLFRVSPTKQLPAANARSWPESFLMVILCSPEFPFITATLFADVIGNWKCKVTSPLSQHH